MKSLILTYFILGVLVNAVVWWATDISAQEAWQLQQRVQTGNDVPQVERQWRVV